VLSAQLGRARRPGAFGQPLRRSHRASACASVVFAVAAAVVAVLAIAYPDSLADLLTWLGLVRR
jgi:hypothetical protein